MTGFASRSAEAQTGFAATCLPYLSQSSIPDVTVNDVDSADAVAADIIEAGKPLLSSTVDLFHSP